MYCEILWIEIRRSFEEDYPSNFWVNLFKIKLKPRWLINLSIIISLYRASLVEKRMDSLLGTY